MGQARAQLSTAGSPRLMGPKLLPPASLCPQAWQTL